MDVIPLIPVKRCCLKIQESVGTSEFVMKNETQNETGHPNPIDRNKAILWARDLLQFPEWVILAVKVSRSNRTSVDECNELVSIAVIGPENNVLLDVLVRPDKAVSNDLLKAHGCDQARAFSSPSFEAIHKILEAGFAKTPVVVWAPSRLQQTLDHLCAVSHLPELRARFISAQAEYSKYVGDELPQGGYEMKQIPDVVGSTEPPSAVSECRKIAEVIAHMAASSQISASALTFNKNWSAAFYRPKIGPTAKIREILGFPPVQ